MSHKFIRIDKMFRYYIYLYKKISICFAIIHFLRCVHTIIDKNSEIISYEKINKIYYCLDTSYNRKLIISFNF